jgi:hypothetical protein
MMFFLGLFIGGVVGFAVMALCSVAKDCDPVTCEKAKDFMDRLDYLEHEAAREIEEPAR